MKALVLYSGGKDSHYALFCALQAGYSCELLSILPAQDSLLFHYPNIKWASLHAKKMGLKIHFTNENDFAQTLNEKIKKEKFNCLVSGAIESEFQKERFDFLCEENKIFLYSPLWRKNKKELMREMLDAMEFIIASVSAEGMGKEFLGKKVDARMLGEFEKKKINISLEGGEGETFVINSPLFDSPVEIKKARIEWDGVRGSYVIEEAQ